MNYLLWRIQPSDHSLTQLSQIGPRSWKERLVVVACPMSGWATLGDVLKWREGARLIVLVVGSHLLFLWADVLAGLAGSAAVLEGMEVPARASHHASPLCGMGGSSPSWHAQGLAVSLGHSAHPTQLYHVLLFGSNNIEGVPVNRAVQTRDRCVCILKCWGPAKLRVVHPCLFPWK